MQCQKEYCLRMVKEVQVSGLQQRWTRASQGGFCRTQFYENLWLIKKHTLYVQFYVCTLLAFAIKDWWGSSSHNFVKGPSAPVSAFHQRNRTSRRCVWRDWLQGTGLSSYGNCLGKCEICRAGLEKGRHARKLLSKAAFLLPGESLNSALKAFKLIESGPSRLSRITSFLEVNWLYTLITPTKYFQARLRVVFDSIMRTVASQSWHRKLTTPVPAGVWASRPFICWAHSQPSIQGLLEDGELWIPRGREAVGVDSRLMTSAAPSQMTSPSHPYPLLPGLQEQQMLQV